MQRVSFRLAFLLVLTAMALIVASCDSGTDHVSTDTPEPAEDTTVGDAVIGTEIPGVDSRGADSPEPDEYTDNRGDSGPQPGEFGWPCDGPEDCDSGYCILTGEKKICTMTCVEECPDDFVCAPVTTTPPDVTYLCLPRFDKLCQPFTHDRVVVHEEHLGLARSGTLLLALGHDSISLAIRS